MRIDRLRHVIVTSMPKSSNAGFTLIELLTVIVLAGILIIATVITGRSYSAKARDALQKENLERVKTALYEYNFDTGCFPQEIPSCGEPFTFANATYLQVMPCKNDGTEFAYQVPETSCPSAFKLLTNLEVIDDPSIARVGCGSGCGDDCNYNYGLSSTNTRIESGCVKYFVCSPGGVCEQFEDPAKSQCPVIFENDSACGGVDCDDRQYRCENSSGKLVPD